MPYAMPVTGEIWLLAGIALLVVELVAPGAFMMWIGFAAIGAGLLTLVSAPPFEVQVIVFAVLTAASIGVALRLRKRPPAQVNTPGSGLVGRTAVALTFHGREGRVRVGDSDWPARLAYGCDDAEPGWMLEVARVEGTWLVVRKKSFGQAESPKQSERRK